jgi:flagellar FliL protein
MSEAKSETAEKKPKSKKLLLIVVGLLVLGGAGGGFFWWKTQASAADPSSAGHGDGEGDHGAAGGHAAADAGVEGAEVLSFAPFIVNLADPGGTRYLKADIRLLVTGVDDIKHLAENQAVMMQIRSAMLEHLSQQVSEQVVTPEGKAALKTELRERSARLLKGHGNVADVLFNEFVVQF